MPKRHEIRHHPNVLIYSSERHQKQAGYDLDISALSGDIVSINQAFLELERDLNLNSGDVIRDIERLRARLQEALNQIRV